MAVLANDNPPFDYGRQKLFTLTPGADSVQWDYSQRDLVLQGGSSTAEKLDGVVQMSDTITSWKPTGEVPPAYRFAVDHCKIWQVIYNLDLIFRRPDWDGAPLIPNDQATTNESAKQPKIAVAEVAAMLDSLSLLAIIADPTRAKESISASIDSTNPKRLNIELTIQLAGNTNLRSVDLNFGFFFGGS